MSRTDLVVVSLLLSLSAGFALCALVNNYHKKLLDDRMMQTHVLTARIGDVIGPRPDFFGAKDAPNTLVEFGDYQCPPCRKANEQINGIIEQYHGKLRFTFRNLPLTTIHQFAMSAAITAEIARGRGSFWPMHDQLYAGNGFDEKAINTAASAVLHTSPSQYANDDKASAKKAIDSDIRESKALKLDATPSFLVCTASGKIVKLDSIDEIAYWIK